MVTPQRIVLLIGLLVLTAQPQAHGQSPQINSTFGSDRSGMAFTQNLGQVADAEGVLHPEILYTASFGGVDIFVAAGRISYVYHNYEGDWEAWKRCDHDVAGVQGDGPIPTHNVFRMDMELIGSNLRPNVLQGDQINGYNNYYLAHCPDGVLQVESYRTIILQDIYPNIDMVLRGNDHGMKCDFIVRSGGRPSEIRMRYLGGTAPPRLINHGELRVENPFGFIQEEAPYSFQQTLSMFSDAARTDEAIYAPNGTEKEVASRWMIADDGVVGFNVGDYDPTRPLVIDPTRRWATFYGGTGSEQMLGSNTIAVDRIGDIYFAGSTNNNTFPASIGPAYAGTNDLVVVKLKSDGTRLWATLLGGSGDEIAHGVATDTARNVFVVGHTASSNFPTLKAHQSTYGGSSNRDAIAAKFDANGVLQWSTYYGGSGLDDAYGCAVDSLGDVSIVGTTESTSGISGGISYDPSYNGGYDMFLAKFNGAGVRKWATYWGGTNNDCGWAITIDKYDNITIGGWTNSVNFPTLRAYQNSNNGSYDACVAQFNRTGNLLWSTYYGGAGQDGVDGAFPLTGNLSLATDRAANVILAGKTSSTNFPLSNPTIQSTFGGGSYDAFIVKFDSAGQRKWATYQGGRGDDRIGGVASNDSNSVLITGATGSVDFPGITLDAFQATKQGDVGSFDAFVMSINATGTERTYGTFYGGIGTGDEGFGIASDSKGSIIVAGETNGGSFPVTVGAYQEVHAGGPSDFFVLFLENIELVSDIKERRSANTSRGATLQSVRPNPAVGEAEVEYEIVEDGMTQLYLVDLLGGVTPLVGASLKAGRYVATVDLSVLPSGLYVCVLQTPTERINTVMHIIR